MVSRMLTITNPWGLHAWPASVLAKEAMKCRSEVTMVVGDAVLNPKSILNIMAAAITQGTRIELRCDGETEKEDLEKLAFLIENDLSGTGFR